MEDLCEVLVASKDTKARTEDSESLSFHNFHDFGAMKLTFRSIFVHFAL